MNNKKMLQKITSLGCDSAVFLDETSQHYLSDFYTTDGVVVVSGAETALLTDSRYIEAASRLKNEGKMEYEVAPYLMSDYGSLSEYLSIRGLKRIAYDPDRITVAQLGRIQKNSPGAEFVPVEELCTEIRRIKTTKEVEKIKAAQQITDAAFTHMLSFLKPGLTEQECAAELEYFMRKSGATGLAFETIAVSGKNSSLPHGVPGSTVLENGVFLTMDFGASFDGYCSDMTRTVVIGKATPEMRSLYESVREAQRIGIEMSKPGVKCSDVDKAVRDYLATKGLARYFGHGLGHSLGLEIHESPRYSAKCDDITVPGHILTVEPGAYLPGKYGVRIEDMVLITETGCEDLTHSPKELIEI